MTVLEVDVARTQGAFTLAARFDSDARVTALFGASGAGKTTLLHVIAGLARPDRGRVVVDGAVLVDRVAGIDVPAHRRRIGYVFQDGRLFPHLDVRGNLRYGERRAPRGDGPSRFDEVVALLGLAPLLARRTTALSGGERQRVAIGRALLARPRLLLLDEPLASVDHARRDDVLAYVARLRDATRVPIVYVSHEPVEIVAVATRVVLLEAGTIVASGTPAEVLAASKLADDPLNVIDAVVAAHEDAYALTAVHAAGGELHVPRADLPVGAAVRVIVRARDVMLATQPPQGLSAQNQLAGTITALRDVDARSVDVIVACAGATLVARVTRRAVDALRLAAGMPVHALVKSVAIDRAARRAGS